MNNALEDKISKVIASCETIDQWISAKRMLESLPDKNSVNYLNMVLILGIKFGVLKNIHLLKQ